MTFAAIFQAIKKQYAIENNHLAKHLHTNEKTVDAWERGDALPSHHQLEHFSEMYALPLSLLEDSVKQK